MNKDKDLVCLKFIYFDAVVWVTQGYAVYEVLLQQFREDDFLATRLNPNCNYDKNDSFGLISLPLWK